MTQVTDSQGGTPTNTYDNADRLATKSFTDGTTSLSQGFVYNNRNDVTEIDRYSDTTQTTLVGKTIFAYDDARQVTSITHKNAAGTTLDSFSYTRKQPQKHSGLDGAAHTAIPAAADFATRMTPTRAHIGRTTHSRQRGYTGRHTFCPHVTRYRLIRGHQRRSVAW